MQTFFSSNRNRSLLLLLFSCISLLVLFGRGMYLVIDGVNQFGILEQDWIGLGPNLMEAGSMFICSVVLIPLAGNSLRQLRGRQLPEIFITKIHTRFIWLFLAGWVFLIVISSVLTYLFEFGWLLASPFFFLSLLLPVWAFCWVAAGGLYKGTKRRLWAALGFGMAGGTSLALLLEFALLIVALAIGSVFVVTQPGWVETLQDLQAQVQAAINMEDILIALSPWLVKPWIFLLVLLFAAVLGPLIEEAVKPLAVWILGKHIHKPAQGFVLGAISGAGFALMEGLMAASGMVTIPYFALPARFASSMMHITLSGIVGWGIVSAFRENRWEQLLGAYFLSSLMHGLWNGSALLAVYGALRFEVMGTAIPDVVSILFILLGIVTLCLLFLLILIALPLINHRLRSAQDDIIAPLVSRIERNVINGLDSPGN